MSDSAAVEELPHIVRTRGCAIFGIRRSNAYTRGELGFYGCMAARYARRAEPVSLTAEELDLEHEKVTTDVPGIPVWAWIRCPDSAELVKGEVFSWASRSVQVKWVDAGARRWTWVWASAVTRRTDPVRQSALGDRTAADDNANRSSSTE